MNTVLLKAGLHGIGVLVEESGITARVIISELNMVVFPKDYEPSSLDTFDEIFGTDVSRVEWTLADYVYKVFCPSGLVSLWYYLISFGF